MKKLLVIFLILSCSINVHAKHKPKESKPKPSETTQSTQPSELISHDETPPITAAEASAIMQVAGGFLEILTAPKDPTHIATGIGAMASGMANLFYQLMKSRGLNLQLSDDELKELAHEMADMVNRGIEIEMVRRVATGL